jgi:hypothetical protein
MKYLLIILFPCMFALDNKNKITPVPDLTQEQVEWLKEHDAYDDVIDAFYKEGGSAL